MYLRKKLPSHSISCRFITKERLKNSILFFGMINLLWLLFRTGTKPSRIVYPCQRTALKNFSFSLTSIFPLSVTATFFTTIKTFFSKNSTLILAILTVGVISGGLILRAPSANPFQEIQLEFESKDATIIPSSDIYVVNGRNAAYVSELVNLMSSNGLFFYKSNVVGNHKGPEGLIARDDVIILKINSQWDQRGGTNTDILKELIQALTDHPDGFIGEIVVADNGQSLGSMDYRYNNAENTTQSTQDVVDMFSSEYHVSTYNWQDIRGNQVDEYSEGDLTDGYFLYDTADPETGIYVSYPKFETKFGTYISFKHGIWNGTGYEKRLKVINMPVLKSHSRYGVTASLKNYMGVQSEGQVFIGGLANGHLCVATGGMGTLMVECGLPTLNIVDAIRVNANPYPSGATGPGTSWNEATRVNILLASVDPAALDYWAAKHVLMQTADLIGHEDVHALDPVNLERSGLEEAFGVWLNLTKNEIVRGGFNITIDENQMSIYVHQDHAPLSSSSTSSTTSSSPFLGFGFVCLVFSLIVIIPLFLRKRKKGYCQKEKIS